MTKIIIITNNNKKKEKRIKESYIKWKFLKISLQSGSKIKEEKFMYKKLSPFLRAPPSHVKVYSKEHRAFICVNNNFQAGDLSPRANLSARIPECSSGQSMLWFPHFHREMPHA